MVFPSDQAGNLNETTRIRWPNLAQGLPGPYFALGVTWRSQASREEGGKVGVEKIVSEKSEANLQRKDLSHDLATQYLCRSVL